MSLNSFNYSFGTQPGGFPGFSNFQQPNQGFYHQQSQFTLNQDPSTSAQQQIPVPNSITSTSDYYGNPQQQEQYNSGEQQQQQGRKRRVKSGRQTRNYFHTPILTEQNDYHGHLAPIMGPIFVKNGHVPVIPLLSYPTVNNGTLLQIPILWTALSYALGLELRGEVLRGLPCIKRLNQLFCPTAGNAYPMKRIESFIDENKALIKRMYGEFMLDPIQGSNTLKRSTREVYEDEIPEFIGDGMARPNRYQFTNENSAEGNRTRRQTVNPKNGPPTQQPKSNRLDSCESTTDITTPYWAANSSGKVRAIVNTKHFEQAIHQEVCTKVKTARCSDDCQCEQKYKWHRLLAYDPDNDCKGIFMDWFLFPSCCVCRCNPTRK